jgi:hypothetical protein
MPNLIVSPQFAATGTYIVFDADSWYDSMQAELEQRYTHGLRFKIAYTWGKAIDEGIDNNSAPNGTPEGSPIQTDHTSGRALAPYDVRHRLAINWSYDLPASSRQGLAGALLNSWQVAGIFQAQSGFPLTAQVGFPSAWLIGNAGADLPDVAPGRSANAVVGGPDQYFDPSAFVLPPTGIMGNAGYTTMAGPGLAMLDASVQKIVGLRGSNALELRMEVFNLLNRTNFGIPDMLLFNRDGTRRGAAGVISQTGTFPREFQFSVKYTF